MINYRFALLLLVTITISSCRDEFSLEGDFQDVPTAYAFLNAEDDRHFVKVQKAFLEAGGNALTNAAIADSIYYDDNEAMVILTNLATNESVELQRVNGDDFGLEREDGIFATEPNVLYSVEDRDINLRGGNRIELRIERPGEEAAVASTNLLEPITIRSPGDRARIGDFNRNVNISWNKVDNARVYDVRLLLNIEEFYPADATRNRTLTLELQAASAFVPGRDQASSSTVGFDVDNESIYRFISDNLEPDSEVRRRFRDFDVRVTAAGQEVLDRQTLANANSGITSSQSLPRYSNLSGGLGLITSTTSTIKVAIDIDVPSRDSLRNGIYTRDLSFL